MKIVLFGATGQTGRYLVPLLVAAGYSLTVFARSPEKVDTIDGKVKIIQGDARNTEAIRAAVAGQDIVISTFGTRSLQKGDIQEIFMRNLIAAMKSTKVNRLIDLSGRGTGDSYQQSSLRFKFIRATILKNIYDDKNRGDALLVKSDINYTLIRPGRLTNGAPKGGVKASENGKELRDSISRQDVARFILTQIESQEWVKKAPVIGY